ncbi:MAG TPA: hypothetical protein VEZ40_20090 [Pyrinomonadaceae bacterium]|nr:hypothetical protein [Pyrinomonadaceae bacterium]
MTVAPAQHSLATATKISGVASEAGAVGVSGTHPQNIEGMITDLMTFLERVFA